MRHLVCQLVLGKFRGLPPGRVMPWLSATLLRTAGVAVLDAPPETVQVRVLARAEDYESLEYLRAARSVYLDLARSRGWTVVDAIGATETILAQLRNTAAHRPAADSRIGTMSFGSGVSWKWWRRHRRHRQPIAPEDGASRITAYVYGNILIMTALIALDSQDLLGPKAAGYVVGTGVSTFLAHLVAELAGSDLGTDRRMTMADLRNGARDSAPIISAMTLPVVLVIVALWGWLDPDWALGLAAGVTIVRIASLGWVVGRFKDRRASFRSIAAGLVLALISTAAALAKFWLTH